MNPEDKYLEDRHKQIDKFEELMQEKLNKFEEYQNYNYDNDDELFCK